MTPSLTSRLSLMMIRTQATTVAVRAVGATNQKSWGDPNQQSGVMNTAQKMISLQGVIQSNTCSHINVQCTGCVIQKLTSKYIRILSMNLAQRMRKPTPVPY